MNSRNIYRIKCVGLSLVWMAIVLLITLMLLPGAHAAGKMIIENDKYVWVGQDPEWMKGIKRSSWRHIEKINYWRHFYPTLVNEDCIAKIRAYYLEDPFDPNTWTAKGVNKAVKKSRKDCLDTGKGFMPGSTAGPGRPTAIIEVRHR